MFLYQKLIDRSTLRQGFQIPVEFHHLLKAMPGGNNCPKPRLKGLRTFFF